MRTPRVVVLALTALLLHACSSAPLEPDWGRPLPDGAPALIKLGPGDPRPDWSVDFDGRDKLLPAIDRSLEWMAKPSARKAFPVEGISYEVALESLERFRETLATSKDAAEFARRIDKDFDVYMSAGWDGRGGGVLFTGYYTPIFEGSRERTAEYSYPLYAMPPDLVKDEAGQTLGQQTASGVRPYPERGEIDGRKLLEGQNLELAWLKNAFDAYVAQVNGSAFLRLPDRSMYRLGYAAQNGHEYVSVREALIQDGRLSEAEANLSAMRAWAAEHPEEVEAYLARNPRYVFFTPISGNPRGSLNVEVTNGRTLATDKTLFPRGAVTFVDTSLGAAGAKRGREFRQFMLDQDTGGAIRTAGRGDIYLGIGAGAERLAGSTKSPGQLYYLFIKS